ncbi:hypothetical protein [Trabulsiella guamensis]|uniref:hypothetical protein n=1 Tax=Trabulsiella guamensis TaxID=158852 RepID=UPI0012EC4DF0|nr:hypothetical protein [Trabulsiella guamensis]
MSISSCNKKLAKQQQQQLLLQILLQHFAHAENCAHDKTEWPSTRQLANAMDISIYKARVLLLEMVNDDLVEVYQTGTRRPLKWSPCVAP